MTDFIHIFATGLDENNEKFSVDSFFMKKDVLINGVLYTDIKAERDALVAQLLFYKFDEHDNCDWEELEIAKQKYWLDLVEQDKATRKEIEK